MKLLNLFEGLKFPIYSTREAELEKTIDTSETSAPEQQEENQLSSLGGYNNTTLNYDAYFTSRNEMILHCRKASYLPEIVQAIEEITNEVFVFDEIEDPVELNLDDIDLPDSIKTKFFDSFKKILYLLDFGEQSDVLFKQFYTDGVLNIETVFDNARIREGIKKLILLTPFNFNSFIDPETGEKKYAYLLNNQNRFSNKSEFKVFLDDQITSINSGIWDINKQFTISYLTPALKTINNLNLIEESLVIHRITRSPEKRQYKIPIKKMNKSKAEEYLNAFMNKFKQKKIYNTDTGTIENRTRSISVLEDYWMPVDENGVGPTVEILQGSTQNFSTFEDVDYFTNKVYKALHIPLNRRAPDSRTTIGNQIDIEKDELKFFKFILKLRKRFNGLFIDLLKKDLIATNVLSIDDWRSIQDKIKFRYANSNEYSEIKNNQIIGMRIDTANSAQSLVDQKMLSSVYVQKNILQLTEEEIEEIRNQNTTEPSKKDDEIEPDSFDGGFDSSSMGDDNFEFDSSTDEPTDTINKTNEEPEKENSNDVEKE